MTHPLRTRAHLEALLIARVLLEPAIADDVDETRLSPAALALLDFASAENTYARASLIAGAQDEFGARLVRRIERLTLDELAFDPIDVTLALVNSLPVLNARADLDRRAA